METEGLKTPNQRKRHKKWTEEGRKKIEKEQQPGEGMETVREKRREIGSEKESTSRTADMQSEREDVCRTPTIDLREVWSMDEDGDGANIGIVAVFTARFRKLLREARDKFKHLMRIT